MQYKIIVDKQPRTNPSSDKRQYTIDIEELRYLGDIYDSLIITKDADYVIRKLSLSEYGVLSVLSKEVIEPIDNVNIELFEGDNYIYLADMTGNYIYAEYLLKNEWEPSKIEYKIKDNRFREKADKVHKNNYPRWQYRKANERNKTLF